MVAVKQFKNQQGQALASIYRESNQGMIMNVWSGDYVAPKYIESVMDYSFDEIRRKKLRCWICDISLIEGALEKASKTALRNFDKKLSNRFLQKFAFISRRSSSEGRVMLERVIQDHGVQVKTFTTFNKAIQWLLVPDIDEDIWDQAPVLTF